jgi:5'-nucleotidase
VAVLPEALDGRDSTVRARPGNLTELITAAIARAAAPVDLPIMNGGSIRIDDLLAAGPITEYDIIRILPFGGEVLRAEVTGELLLETLTAGAGNLGTGGYLHPRGAARVDGEWRLNGQPIDPDRWYSIALPEYLLTGAELGMPFLVRTSPRVRNVKGLGDIRQAVIAELKARFAGEARALRLRPVRSRPAADTLLHAPGW